MFESFKNKAFLVFAAVILFAMTATAGTVTVNFGSASAYQDGYGVGVYVGSVTNGSVTTPTNFICDDFDHEIVGGQSWLATTEVLSPLNPASEVEYNATTPGSAAFINGLTQQEDYNAIGFLAGLIFADTNNGDGQWGNLSEAIWSLNSAAAYSAFGAKPDVANDLNFAILFDDNPEPGFTIYTPDPAGAQEFISFTGSGDTQTPEPASVLLFGTALLGLGKLLKKQLSV